MAQYRLQRINEVLRRELAHIMPRCVAFPPAVLFTINAVQIAPDLRNADVLVSFVGGTPADQEQALADIEKARGEIQRELGGRISIKFTPHLRFSVDHSVEEGTRMLQILDNLPPPAEPDKPPAP